MAFPRNPTNKQEHHSGGVLYVYNAASNQWRIGPPAKHPYPFLEYEYGPADTAPTGDVPHSDEDVVFKTDGIHWQLWRPTYDVFDDKWVWSTNPAQGGSPVGEIIVFPTAGATPQGYFPCDGTQFNTTQHPQLQAVLGSDTLPNMTGGPAGTKYLIRASP